MNRTIPLESSFKTNTCNFDRCSARIGKAVVFAAAIALTIPTFAASTCDSLVGEFARKANGTAWLRIDKKDETYVASTHGPLFGKEGEKADWNDEPATPLDLIPEKKLTDSARLNGNQIPVTSMCGLSGGRIIILKVPIGYRYGQEPGDISKTGYVMAVYADEYGYGTTELYPH